MEGQALEMMYPFVIGKYLFHFQQTVDKQGNVSNSNHAVIVHITLGRSIAALQQQVNHVGYVANGNDSVPIQVAKNPIGLTSHRNRHQGNSCISAINLDCSLMHAAPAGEIADFNRTDVCNSTSLDKPC